MRILIAEDDADIAALIAHYLEKAGYASESVSDGGRALATARETPPDLIILDLMLPGLNGLEVCKALRLDNRTAALPIIMLTARGEESERILGLGSGADDYVVKPFSPNELMARVRALLRRGPAGDGRPAPAADTITYKHILVDPARRRVRVGASDVDLTTNEFQLLSVLLSSPGIVFSREALLNRVWKDQTYVTVRSVDTLVKRLRKKVEADPGEPEVILTVWGAGYKAADA